MGRWAGGICKMICDILCEDWWLNSGTLLYIGVIFTSYCNWKLLLHNLLISNGLQLAGISPKLEHGRQKTGLSTYLTLFMSSYYYFKSIKIRHRCFILSVINLIFLLIAFRKLIKINYIYVVLNLANLK